MSKKQGKREKKINNNDVDTNKKKKKKKIIPLLIFIIILGLAAFGTYVFLKKVEDNGGGMLRCSYNFFRS